VTPFHIVADDSDALVFDGAAFWLMSTYQTIGLGVFACPNGVSCTSLFEPPPSELVCDSTAQYDTNDCQIAPGRRGRGVQGLLTLLLLVLVARRVVASSRHAQPPRA
jgi:hypothetical protein